MAAKLDGPWIRTPGAHMTGTGGWTQFMGGVCGKIELNLFECFEAYGYDKGRKYCAGYLSDYYECRFREKQIKRRDAMEWEKKKQYYTGQTKDRYDPVPETDSY